MQESKKCPRCLTNDIKDPGVLSRHDNETLICAPCGLEETQINHTPFGVESLKEVVEREKRIPLKTTGKWFDVPASSRPVALEALLRAQAEKKQEPE
jgi:hypothetical protein